MVQAPDLQRSQEVAPTRLFCAHSAVNDSPSLRHCSDPPVGHSGLRPLPRTQSRESPQRIFRPLKHAVPTLAESTSQKSNETPFQRESIQRGATKIDTRARRTRHEAVFFRRSPRNPAQRRPAATGLLSIGSSLVRRPLGTGHSCRAAMGISTVDPKGCRPYFRAVIIGYSRFEVVRHGGGYLEWSEVRTTTGRALAKPFAAEPMTLQRLRGGSGRAQWRCGRHRDNSELSVGREYPTSSTLPADSFVSRGTRSRVRSHFRLRWSELRFDS